jgi:hypothetical protein
MKVQFLSNDTVRSLIPNEDKTHTIGETTPEFFRDFFCDNKVERYIQILCSPEELNDEYLIPAYMKFIATRQYSLISILSENLPVDCCKDLAGLEKHAIMSSKLVTASMNDKILLIIGRYKDSVSTELNIDSLWRAIFKD